MASADPGRPDLCAVYRARGDANMVRWLDAATTSMADVKSLQWMRLRDAATYHAGVGHTLGTPSVNTGIVPAIWQVRADMLRDKVALWRGMIWSRPFFREDLLRDDLRTRLMSRDYLCLFSILPGHWPWLGAASALAGLALAAVSVVTERQA